MHGLAHAKLAELITCDKIADAWSNDHAFEIEVLSFAERIIELASAITRCAVSAQYAAFLFSIGAPTR